MSKNRQLVTESQVGSNMSNELLNSLKEAGTLNYVLEKVAKQLNLSQKEREQTRTIGKDRNPSPFLSHKSSVLFFLNSDNFIIQVNIGGVSYPRPHNRRIKLLFRATEIWFSEYQKQPYDPNVYKWRHNEINTTLDMSNSEVNYRL